LCEYDLLWGAENPNIVEGAPLQPEEFGAFALLVM
jgi:hypothetical protein